jgi:iron complex outermembrane recepter protein
MEGWMKRLLLMGCILSLLIVPLRARAADQVAEEEGTTKESTATVQSGKETETERSKVYMKIGEVVVTEKSDYLTTADVPASVDVIGADQIEMENVDFSMELMKKVPGAYYGDWNQGVVSGTFSMRGFDANHDVPATLIVDGIPHNFGYGRMDIQPFFPLEIDRIEVVKGTADPRYGVQNVAGDVNIHTKRGGNFSQTKLLTGSYKTYDAGTIIGRDDGNFSQTYFVGYRQTDGYREHSDLKKGAASGKWFYTTSDQKFTAGVIARFFSMDADAPGYLTKEQAEEDPRQAAPFAVSDGGEQQDQHISAHMDYAFTDRLTWSFKTYFQHLDRTRWCRWSLAGSQQERVNDDDQYGAISTITYEITDRVIPRLKIDWGIDYQHQDNLAQRWTTDNRVREGQPTRDLDSSWYNWGSYLQADGDITDWLRLMAALRVDTLDGEMTNRSTGLTTDMVDMDYIWQPKAGVVVTPWKGYNLYGNYGRTFQTASSPTLYGQTTSGGLISRDIDYSKNDGWEVGIKTSPFTWLSGRIDYWKMVATDEIRSKGDTSGDVINAGKTTRDGWDFSLSVRPHDWVAVWGSYSIIEAKYTDPGPGLESRKGNDIENIPDFTSKAGIDFSHPSGLFSNLWVEIQGDYAIDAENLKAKDGAYTVWNWSLGYKWNNATFGFDIKNLFDADYNSFIWDYDEGYSPGDARSYYAWVALDY